MLLINNNQIIDVKYYVTINEFHLIVAHIFTIPDKRKSHVSLRVGKILCLKKKYVAIATVIFLQAKIKCEDVMVSRESSYGPSCSKGG